MTTETLEAVLDEAKVAQRLRELDFELWYRKSLVRPARQRLEQELGVKIPTRTFKRLREASCLWWKKVRRPKPCVTYGLDSDGWEQLRAAVREQADLIRGRELGEAVAIVSLVCPCNRHLLEGLNRDLHLWRE